MIASTNCGEVMSLVRKPDINGLTNYEYIDRLPEEVLKVRRRSTYDNPISEAKAGRIIKLSFQSKKIATNRYLALREKLKKEKTLAVRRSANGVYLFPRKLLKKK
jgi:hypothetical protein